MLVDDINIVVIGDVAADAATLNGWRTMMMSSRQVVSEHSHCLYQFLCVRQASCDLLKFVVELVARPSPQAAGNNHILAY